MAQALPLPDDLMRAVLAGAISLAEAWSLHDCWLTSPDEAPEVEVPARLYPALDRIWLLERVGLTMQ